MQPKDKVGISYHFEVLKHKTGIDLFEIGVSCQPPQGFILIITYIAFIPFVSFIPI
jgi:hypothetical protein